jgi:transaldolase
MSGTWIILKNLENKNFRQKTNSMGTSAKERMHDFILAGISEKTLTAPPDPFWQGLRDTGTELWLDTGDMDEAAAIWTAEMSALTTNNTLIHKEIQKGIYDAFIAEAREIVKDLPVKDQVMEIAFILNARHGMRLAKKFGGFVSVELHTDISHDLDAIVEFGQRYHRLNPGQFIVKVPYTATGLLGARKLREHGVRVNFTLEFSARQNVFVSLIAGPDYTNVFLGRLGAYLKDNGLGDGSGIGERAVLSSQHWVGRLTRANAIPTRLIAASLRSADQLESLAGVDVFTMPTAVAASGRENLGGDFRTRLEEEPEVDATREASQYYLEKVWEVTPEEEELARDLAVNLPANGEELIRRAREAGCKDMFPELGDGDLRILAEDGKIPRHARWADRMAAGELAIDTLLNLAGLASFATDQAALDARIRRIIGRE